MEISKCSFSNGATWDMWNTGTPQNNGVQVLTSLILCHLCMFCLETFWFSKAYWGVQRWGESKLHLIPGVAGEWKRWMGSPVREHEQSSGNTGNSKGSARAKFTSYLEHPPEYASCPWLSINLKVIPDQGEKVENVIKAQVACSLLFPVLFSEVRSDHNLLAQVRELPCGKVLTCPLAVLLYLFLRLIFSWWFWFWRCRLLWEWLVAMKTSLLTCLHISMNWECIRKPKWKLHLLIFVTSVTGSAICKAQRKQAKICQILNPSLKTNLKFIPL